MFTISCGGATKRDGLRAGDVWGTIYSAGSGGWFPTEDPGLSNGPGSVLV
jgi:hypothetical protein